MLQRSVTLMRRLRWSRPKLSMRAWAINSLTRTTDTSSLCACYLSLLHFQHTLNRNQRAAHDVFRHLDPRFEMLERIAKFLERIQPHIRALAAVAVLVFDVMELFRRGDTGEREVDTAL